MSRKLRRLVRRLPGPQVYQDAAYTAVYDYLKDVASDVDDDDIDDAGAAVDLLYTLLDELNDASRIMREHLTKLASDDQTKAKV